LTKSNDKKKDPKTKLGTQAELRSLTGSGGLVRADVKPKPETKTTTSRE
jgi:hypothetical protein